MQAKIELFIVVTTLLSVLHAFRWPLPEEYYSCTGDTFTRSDYESAQSALDAELTSEGVYVDTGAFVDNIAGSATAYVCNYISTWLPTWAVIFTSGSFDKVSATLDEKCGPEGGGFYKWQFQWVSTSEGRGNSANHICLDGNIKPCLRPPCPTGVSPTASNSAAKATGK